MRIALTTLKEKKLYTKFKCESWLQEITFFGHVVSGKGILVHREKIEIEVKWAKLSNVNEVRSLLGPTGYYKRFVERFLSIAAPMMRLTSKNIL